MKKILGMVCGILVFFSPIYFFVYHKYGTYVSPDGKYKAEIYILPINETMIVKVKDKNDNIIKVSERTKFAEKLKWMDCHIRFVTKIGTFWYVDFPCEE